MSDNIKDQEKYTVQEHVKDEPVDEETSDIFSVLVSARSDIPAWWSQERDEKLLDFARGNDYIQLALTALEEFATTTEWRFVARDSTIRSHVEQAASLTREVKANADFGKGYATWVSRFVQSYTGQDNGSFTEVIGRGRKSGPLIGTPINVASLDSRRCTRTSNPIYPVVYMDDGGSRRKLHYTRVMCPAQMPSSTLEMNGVGYCAVSRCLNTAQVLGDILTYKQEKMGSRPMRAILVAEGIDLRELQDTLAMDDSIMDAAGFTRYSRVPAIASKHKKITITLVPLSQLPDGFNEEVSTSLGVYLISGVYGLDAREIWPATSSGATKADAETQHMKARKKGKGQLLRVIKDEFERRFLPAYLMMVFDAQDDEQDAVRAELQKLRAERREIDLQPDDEGQSSITIRVSRELMLADGDITQSQFDEMELRDGRLPDGSDVLLLFRSPEFEPFLDLAVPFQTDPLDVEANDPVLIQALALRKLNEVEQVVMNGKTGGVRQRARQAAAALNALLDLYEPPPVNPVVAEEEAEAEEGESVEGPEVVEEVEEKTLTFYEHSIRSHARRLWTGAMDEYEFVDSLTSIIITQYRKAWAEGMAQAGIGFEAINAEERAKLDELTNAATDRVIDLAIFILEQKEQGRVFADLSYRLRLWTRQYDTVRLQALVMAGQDIKLEWVLGASEKHCPSCMKLGGKVKRASVWAAAGVYPKSPPNPKLECEGWGDCTLVPTDKPCSRGPLPNLP